LWRSCTKSDKNTFWKNELFHTDYGGDAVILSAELFASMQETLHLMYNPANAKALMTSLEQHKAGKVSVRDLTGA